MEDGVAEYRFGNAIVRIHPGKLSKEERQAAIEEATRKYLKKVLVARKRNAANAAKKGSS